MKIVREALAGTLESSDLLVRITGSWFRCGST
jgi:citrate lyase gamma subunit